MESANTLKQSDGGQRSGLPPDKRPPDNLASGRSHKEKPSVFLILAQRYFNYLILLQALIVLFLGYWFLLSPKIVQVYKNDTESALADKQMLDKIKQYEESINKYREVKSMYGAIKEEDIAKINMLLPDEEMLRDFLLQLDKIIAVNGATLEKVTLDDMPEDSSADSRSRKRAAAGGAEKETAAVSSKIADIAVTFTVKNISYASFKSLLSGLENNLRLVDVNEVKYSPEEGTAEFMVKAYYMK